MSTHDRVTAIDAESDESGCTVDWSWLEGLTIESATSDLRHWRVRLSNGQTLTIQAALYQGTPFLAFDPYKPRL
jgi:hypothetical protein